MTSVPMSSGSSPSFDLTGSTGLPEAPPVFALKELVARLQREQYKIQDLLSSLGFALRSLNNLNQFLELIPMIASRVTDAGGGALVLFRADGQVRLERLHCQSEDHCQNVRSALEAATRQVTASLQPTADTSITTMARNAMVSLDHQVNRYLGDEFQLFGTAIIVQNVERGRLYVFSRDPDYAWTETRQKLVRLVADQTSVAIENNELTVALRKKERLDREMEIGAEIQLQLLPRQCPTIAGMDLAAKCKTAQRVGGDYYDFIPTTYDQLRYPGSDLSAAAPWSLAIGDVMGKGVPAGLIMTMMRGMLRAEVLNGHSPAQILQNLNFVMHSDLENSNRFVTLFYAEYDPTRRLLAYGNAAHNPPFLWKAATGTMTRLDTVGMLLGLDMTTQYYEADLELQPGDTVIFYTDGFTEAANARGERFEEENLERALQWACRNCATADDILNYTFDLLNRFIGGDRSNDDDMTLVVMRVKPDAA
ncbi:PP2C family protein-serine/threonine phosphatase [Phormidium sp. FACHB-1136]|jgi:sigma-B regulation protein RsbU (phosphoserine phosphatase)|uniref:PP2C family protein-serine/threonine phosphatase n=1 Tax=Phormidium sp. FACHB-1136 TaxID=2692848 RepID=UPI0016878CAF|nr:PP2C family protein-serine/threonine phosphatase [Phormidium sp. FACHB-1136]MBD2425648.1 PP2C family protein-serine/threonine phosphatase [Phormidium sp. FACHB-1136]